MPLWCAYGPRGILPPRCGASRPAPGGPWVPGPPTGPGRISPPLTSRCWLRHHRRWRRLSPTLPRAPSRARFPPPHGSPLLQRYYRGIRCVPLDISADVARVVCMTILCNHCGMRFPAPDPLPEVVDSVCPNCILVVRSSPALTQRKGTHPRRPRTQPGKRVKQ